MERTLRRLPHIRPSPRAQRSLDEEILFAWRSPVGGVNFAFQSRRRMMPPAMIIEVPHHRKRGGVSMSATYKFFVFDWRLGGVLLFLLPSLLAAEDWPQFRGPNCSGVSTSKKPLLTEFS